MRAITTTLSLQAIRLCAVLFTATISALFAEDGSAKQLGAKDWSGVADNSDSSFAETTGDIAATASDANALIWGVGISIVLGVLIIKTIFDIKKGGFAAATNSIIAVVIGVVLAGAVVTFIL